MQAQRTQARRSARSHWVVVLLCVAALAVSPLLGHRADCHVKPRTDCGACVASSNNARPEARVAVEHRPLAPVATVHVAGERRVPGPSLLEEAGRAPPA